MTLAATFEAIDLIELLVVIALIVGVIAVFWAMFRRSDERTE